MLTRREMIVATICASGLPCVALAETDKLSATNALTQLQNGSLILLDIRTPEEWQASGVAQGAWPMDMRAADFGERLLTTLANNPERKVAVICRSGTRSGRVMDLLAQNGIDGVLDVTEGMLGGPRGRGWIPSGLPVVSAQKAVSSVPEDLTLR